MENADALVKIFSERVIPHIGSLEGCRGCYLLRREQDGETVFQVLSLWDSLAAIRVFSGPDETTAVVDPEVADLALCFDSGVVHDTVVVDTTGR
jgi:heme-degrading monooxygenase HmoA